MTARVTGQQTTLPVQSMSPRGPSVKAQPLLWGGVNPSAVLASLPALHTPRRPVSVPTTLGGAQKGCGSCFQVDLCCDYFLPFFIWPSPVSGQQIRVM